MLPLRLVATLAWACAAVADNVRYDIICDAGSTGTRMYLFTSTLSVDGEGKETLKVATDVIGKKKPGLSSYVVDPSKAVPPLLELFEKVQKKIPQAQWTDTTVTVMGTAGMRTLALPSQRQRIYDAVRDGIGSSKEYVFSQAADMFKLHTLTGTEEGTFSMLCVNFLTGRLDHHLSVTKLGSEEKLLGILDLGGSSTQIAVPPVNVDASTDLRAATTVRSYASYGMEQMRGKLDQQAYEKGIKSSPCYFKGYTEPTHGLEGSGDALQCRSMLQKHFRDSKKTCAEGDHECLPGNDAITNQAGVKGTQFYAVSGYLYVTDFASHWLLRNGSQGGGIAATMQQVGNRPTVEELEAAGDELCNSDWKDIEKATLGGAATGAHKYTDASKAHHRCLEINYVVTLLRLYGFPGDKRFLTFEDEVDGNDVEWPLGALLQMRHEEAQASGRSQEL